MNLQYVTHTKKYFIILFMCINNYTSVNNIFAAYEAIYTTIINQRPREEIEVVFEAYIASLTFSVREPKTKCFSYKCFIKYG